MPLPELPTKGLRLLAPAPRDVSGGTDHANAENEPEPLQRTSFFLPSGLLELDRRPLQTTEMLHRLIENRLFLPVLSEPFAGRSRIKTRVYGREHDRPVQRQVEGKFRCELLGLGRYLN